MHTRAVSLLKLGAAFLSSIASSITFDGTNMWVVDGNSPARISKRDAVSGTVLATYSAGAYSSAAGFEGANLWLVNEPDDTVTKIPFAK